MKKRSTVGYFQNEKGDYTITINDKPVGFVKLERDAKLIADKERFDDEHQVGDYVDVILNFMPDDETPDNYLTAGKVIKKHYDKEDDCPCAYDLEFTTEISHDSSKHPNRITTRLYNVAEKFVWMRDTHGNMDSAGVQIAKLKQGIDSDEIGDRKRLDALYRSEYATYQNDTRSYRDRIIDEVINAIDPEESVNEVIASLQKLKDSH